MKLLSWKYCLYFILIVLLFSQCDKLKWNLAKIASVATVVTIPISNITSNSAICGGRITNDGGAKIIEKGVCWSTLSSPTILLSTKTTDGNGNGSYSSNITGLVPNTLYYVRAYATNSIGTSYGNELNINTSVGLPILITSSINLLTDTTAVSGGTITNDGGSTINARGVCWSTSPDPNILSGTKTTNGNGIGNYESDISGLIPFTVYYVRAYATNNVGTGYGDNVSFTPHYNIGQNYGGGIIFYVSNSGLHGLIAAPIDQSTSLTWSYSTTIACNSYDTTIGSGFTNTNSIISHLGTSYGDYAALICRNYSGGGYNDWYLPSLGELIQLCNKKDLVSNLSNGDYWSSSEYYDYSPNNAWFVRFSNSLIGVNPKDFTKSVRAIRSY